MKSSIDYNAIIGQLGMGDRFKLEEHAAVVTVAWTDHSTDGSVMYVRDSNGDLITLATYRRCFIVDRAPSCGCGRRYELCDRGCDWPDALEILFAV